MKNLVAKWRAEAAELERRASQLDFRRNCDSTYYSYMTVHQRENWDRLRNESGELRDKLNLLNRLAAELESAIENEEPK
jgi:hypothetical protein